ncbi:MAG: ROK family protein [Candidatus Omnitrophota bacterium]
MTAKRWIIGIDLGGTNTRIGLLDDALHIKGRVVSPTKKIINRERLLDFLSCAVDDLLSGRGLKRRDVCGIGMGLPGPVDARKGIVYYLPNIRGWRDVALAAVIKKRIGISARIDNDVNLITLGELYRGAGRGAGNMVCLTLGTGVGGGIVVGGSLYRGSSFSAGEIGHIPLSSRGPKCGCGARGCLESYVGNARIIRKARKIWRDIDLPGLSQKAVVGDIKAIAVWRDIGEHLGLALCGVVNFFNPDRIVIGGGVSAAGETLFSVVRDVIRKRAMSPAKDRVKIVRARLGDDAGLIGAGVYVRQRTEG